MKILQEIEELIVKMGSGADPSLITSVRRIPIQSAMEVCEREQLLKHVDGPLRLEIEALSRRCGLHWLG